MSSQIIWLDNDPPQILPYRKTLEDAGYQVTVVRTVSEAKSYLNSNNHFDLLILDILIPTKNQDEEKIFHPVETERGTQTGLTFYKHMKEQLQAMNTKVLVLTVRVDKNIRDKFINAGLPPERFCTKFSLREVDIFMDKVQTLLSNNKP